MIGARLRQAESEFQEPQALMRHLGSVFRIPEMDTTELLACTPDFDILPYTEAARRLSTVVRSTDGRLLAVLGDPFDTPTQDWLEERIRQPFAYRLAHHATIASYLGRHEQALRAMDSFAADGTPGVHDSRDAEQVSMEAISEGESPAVKLVVSTLYDALKSGASDIHLESGAQGLTVKYRIDGVLETARKLTGQDLADRVLSRIKVMAELDIAERRVPQDGRFRAQSKDRDIDFRVSVMPSIYGEDAVLRILDKRALSDELNGLTLEALGFRASAIAALRRLSAEPHGMLLVTGPTGSGKTTTLYAVISEANNGRDKIVTIEDPVEYQLAGVLQIPVNEKKGLTFARGLRSILRHDPDRIMVGEIRDPETAEIAVQSSLTGHLVYTTVHANSVYEVLGRFVHMGTDVFNLASALNGVIAQRLLRLTCKACSGRGCAACRSSGYRGRKAVAEVMVLNDDLRELIASRAPTRRLREAARATGSRSLREAAIELAEAGETTMEEVDRVTSLGG
jgi:general secretion pathway protein E